MDIYEIYEKYDIKPVNILYQNGASQGSQAGDNNDTFEDRMFPFLQMYQP